MALVDGGGGKLGRRVDASVLLAGPIGLHALRAGWALTLLVGCVALYAFLFGAGNVIVRDGGPLEKDSRVSIPFQIENTESPILLRIATDIEDGIIDLGISVFDADGAAIHRFDEKISYHTGHNRRGRYVEKGSPVAERYFDLTEAGNYSLVIQVPPWALNEPMASVELRQGHMSWRLPAAIAGILFTLTVYLCANRWHLRQKREGQKSSTHN